MIVLSWPPRTLSPNGRPHWRVKAKAARIAKDEGFIATKAARVRVDPGLVPMRVIFNPPTARNRDIDNLAASMKPAMDGIALALGVDDHVFRPAYEFGETFKGGRVVVEIDEASHARPIGDIIKPIVARIAAKMEDAA